MTLANGILDIDHVMCQVGDTEQAGAAFERLGFSTTPRSSIAAGGVANRLVILTPRGDGVANFIELMAIEDRERLEPSMADILAGVPGIKSLVNALESADAARLAHIASGFSMLDVWPKQRKWRLPSGEELLVAFRVVIPAPDQVPLMV
ncbi:MAG: VOC family protein, partial [Mycobacteriales bacterium]